MTYLRITQTNWPKTIQEDSHPLVKELVDAIVKFDPGDYMDGESSGGRLDLEVIGDLNNIEKGLTFKFQLRNYILYETLKTIYIYYRMEGQKWSTGVGLMKISGDTAESVLYGFLFSQLERLLKAEKALNKAMDKLSVGHVILRDTAKDFVPHMKVNIE